MLLQFEVYWDSHTVFLLIIIYHYFSDIGLSIHSFHLSISDFFNINRILTGGLKYRPSSLMFYTILRTFCKFCKTYILKLLKESQ